MDRSILADEIHGIETPHHNCCQSVLLAFADKINVPKEELFKLASAFGGGMGGMQATCGAICGAALVIGYLHNKEGELSKMAAGRVLEQFKQRVGATICADIKGVNTGKALCSCQDCVKIAAELAQKELGL